MPSRGRYECRVCGPVFSGGRGGATRAPNHDTGGTIEGTKMSALNLRLPDSIHRHIREIAEREGVSINSFITTAVSEKISAVDDGRLPFRACPLCRRKGHSAASTRCPIATPCPATNWNRVSQAFGDAVFRRHAPHGSLEPAAREHPLRESALGARRGAGCVLAERTGVATPNAVNFRPAPRQFACPADATRLEVLRLVDGPPSLHSR